VSSRTEIRSKPEMADMLERFFGLTPVESHTAGREWDDFENERFDNPSLEAWRQRVLREVGHLVAPSRDAYFDNIADDRIGRIIASLRKDEDA
jgi:hypothetical protein